MQAKVDAARKQTVETIVEMMKNKGLMWVKEWSNAFGEGSMPRNGVSGRWYAGGNALHLMARAYMNEWKDPRWFTFKQAKELGYFPEKGSNGALVEYYRMFSGMKDKDGKWTKNEDEAESTFSYMRLVGVFYVFNAEQLFDSDGKPMPREKHVQVNEDDLDAHMCEIADQLIDTSRCPINEVKGEMRAYYRPGSDSISLPSRTQFTNMEAFITTLTHEMTHSTIPVFKRRVAHRLLDREGYAFEELIAELGSTFVSLELGVHRSGELEADENFKNHAAYLKSWLGALESNPDYLFKAASHASKAATYLLDRYNGEVREETAA